MATKKTVVGKKVGEKDWGDWSKTEVEEMLDLVAQGKAEMTSELETKASDYGIDIPTAPNQSTSAPTSAPSAVDTSYAANLPTQEKSQYQKEMERVEQKYAERAAQSAQDAAWVQQREQRDVETQLEAVNNGDAALTDELKIRADEVGVEVPEDIYYAANATPQETPTAKPTDATTGGTTGGETGEKKDDDEPIYTYEQFVNETVNGGDASKSIYGSTVTYWDNETKKALDALAASKENAESYAANILDSTKKAADARRESSYAAAKQQREMTYEEAKNERERASVDANNSYAQNMAGYGANAERMAAMGLTTSGASDYANAKAYAQNRAEIQGANAKAREEMRYADYEERQAKLAADSEHAATVLDAENTYAKNMQDIQTNYDSDVLGVNQSGAKGKLDATLTYLENLGNSAADKQQKAASLLQMAAQGELDSQTLADLAKGFGLSEEQIGQITAAADRKATADAQATADAKAAEDAAAAEKQAAYEQEIIDDLGEDYAASDVDDLDLPDEKKTELKQAAYDKVLSQAQAAIKANGGQLGDLSDVDEAFQNGNLDEKTYKQIYRENATALATNAKTAEDIAAVEQQLETYATQGKITTAERKAAIDQLYKSAVQSVKNDGKVTFDGSMTGTVNFNGNEYPVKIAANTADKQTQTILNKIHSGAKDGDMARVDGKIYMIRNGKWRLVTDAYSNGFYQAYERYYGDHGNRETTGGGNNLPGGGVSSEVTQANK